jgi:hypothetical protein
MRLYLIACEVIYREMCAAIAHAPNLVDARFMPKALHDIGAGKMRASLQKEIDAVDASRYDAIVLGYALCGCGVAGLRAGSTPLVIARAHDCIGLLLGGVDPRLDDANKRCFYRSTGWIERAAESDSCAFNSIVGDVGRSLDQFVERYGEDNGRYLYEEFSRHQHNYDQLVYIRTGVEPDASFASAAQREAHEKGWRFSAIDGSMRLFTSLLAGEWSQDDFAIAPPGSTFAASYDDRIMRVIP